MGNKEIKIALLGDIALHGLFYSEPEKNENRFQKARELLSDFDMVFANLETPVVGNGQLHLKKKEIMGVLLYSDSLIISDVLSKLNISAVSIANNHIYDCLNNGVQNTTRTLNSLDIAFTGAGTEAEHLKPVIIEKNGIRIAFLAYVHPSSNPIIDGDEKNPDLFLNLYNEEEVINQIKNIKKNSDHIIVSVHWGVDYSHYPTTDQIKSYRKLIDAGADIIMGHHSHTVQPFERYKDKYIFYSLGSFCFGDFIYKGKLRSLKRKTKKTIAPVLTIGKKIKLNYFYSLRELKGNTIILSPKSLRGFLARKWFLLKLKNRFKLVDQAIRFKETFFDRVVEYFFGYYRSSIKQLLRISNLKKIKYSIRDYKSRKNRKIKTNKK